MESISTVMKRVEAQEMISRFKSKEDLYRYLTQHGNITMYTQTTDLVGLFLPTMEGTKISFLKAIVCDEKKAFKNQGIKLIEIPTYPQIFVTNLYEDAMKDQDLVVYLPTKKQLSNKLPERSFFFGVLGTLRENYLREIIEEAHKKRFSISTEDQKKQGILISESQLTELKKHPYLSRKPGTGIFLMKDNAKVHRERNSQTIHEVSKRLYKDVQKPDEMNIDAGAGSKRRNMIPSKAPEEEKKYNPNPIKGSFNM